MTFLNELYEEEFDEALFELVREASGLYQDRFLPERRADHEAERMLVQHFAPLVQESESMLDALATGLGGRPLASLNESEIEALVDGYTPAVELTPSFENFFGSLKKLVKKVAKGAVNLAKTGLQAVSKLGLGFILNKIKALIKPLLRKVLRAAIDKLPSRLQPLALKLAERLPFLKELETEDPETEGQASYDVTELQHEFNQQIANLLFAPGQVEQELEVARAAAEAQASVDPTLAELDQARERFINELSRLKEGEDPTPHLENFIPAVLPALKLGLKLIGRKRVVNFLANLLAKLIQRFIGPQYAPALSQAIADSGLRLMGLEVTREDEVRAAPTAVAATLEDTVRRVAALPEYVLDNPELLEGFALEAFEQAAAANLPPILPEAVYRERPDLLEASGAKGCWLMMPLRGRKRYKKFSRVFKIELTPHKATAVETFGGVPLADFLQDQLGLPPGSDLEADVHLYESLPGTTLPELAHLESGTPGLGSGSEQATAQLHPLTPEAAGMLLGQPRLGRLASAKALSNRRAVEVGQRFYHVAIPGRRPLMVPVPGGRARVRRPSGLHITLDFPADQIRVYLYLSEMRAQQLAVGLRKQTHLGTIIAFLGRLLERGLHSVLSGLMRGRVKIVHEALTPEQALGGVLRRLPYSVQGALAKKLHEWLLEGLTDFLKQQGQRIIAAAEDPRDGITMVFTLRNPPSFASLRQALRGKMPPLSDLRFLGGAPSVQVDVVPGHQRG